MYSVEEGGGQGGHSRYLHLHFPFSKTFKHSKKFSFLGIIVLSYQLCSNCIQQQTEVIATTQWPR